MRLTEAQAKALGITDKQIREAKLTPTAAKLRPETPKAPPKDGTAMLRARLEVMYPGEVETAFYVTDGLRTSLAISCQRIAITLDRWGSAREQADMAAKRCGWRLFHYTSAALTTKAALDLACVEIGAAYGAQEGEREEKK